jgi:hypothetical protein
MADKGIYGDFERFRDRRAWLNRQTEATLEPALQTEGILAVGLMIGGGFPGAAACVSALLEARFPEVEDWPWLKAEG